MTIQSKNCYTLLYILWVKGMQAKFKNVKIRGISTVLPEKEINICDEARYYGNDIKKIDRLREITGINTRRVCEEGVTASDLSIQAAEKLINDIEINKEELDGLIFVRQRPDYSIPATSFYIHKKLGLSENTFAFDISLGCSGWVEGLFAAFSMIESGGCKKILLCAGDTPSKDMSEDNRICAPIFSDGGSATLLEYSKEENPSYFDLGSDSNSYESIITPARGGVQTKIKL